MKLSEVTVEMVRQTCKTGDINQLKQWKAEGNLPEFTYEYDNALHLAMDSGQLEVVEWLILHSGQCGPDTVETILGPWNYTEDPDICRLCSEIEFVLKAGIEFPSLQQRPELMDIVDQIYQYPRIAKTVESGLLSIEDVLIMSDAQLKALQESVAPQLKRTEHRGGM